MTNADHIRAMTDEELAEYLCKAVLDGIALVFPGLNFTQAKIEELNKDWLNWLQERVSEDE